MKRLIDENTLSQKELILQYLKRHKASGMSDNDARELFGINRASGRIFDLRKDGYVIVTEYKNGRTRYGKKTRYGVYKLK